MLKTTLRSVFLLFCFLSTLQAQQLNISWKRICDMAIYDFSLEEYDRYAFQLFDIYVEKPLSSPYFSIGLDLTYGNYRPELPRRYNYLGGNKAFFDRSFAMGLVGRVYTKPKVFRGFAEIAIYGNYIHVHQPVVIQHEFGTYERIISHKQTALSGSVAVGFSLGGERIRWEPYMQIGKITEIEEMRASRFFTSSIGLIHEDSRVAMIISPLVVKVLL